MIHNITDRERSLEAVVAQLSQGRDALANRVEALEADAARYRWLRSPSAIQVSDLLNKCNEAFDAAIDAAMEADKP